MGGDDLTCRYCGQPIAVPASSCPWCAESIMVICASCRQYTDDQESLCQHCGAPLEPDSMEQVRAVAGLDADIAQLVTDRERARLVASGVVARYLPGFFFADRQRRTVLVDLFGAPPDPQREASALIFAAVAFLVQEGYCALRPMPDAKSLEWFEAVAWDGQVRSLEGALARRAGVALTIRQAVDQLVADEMGFRFEVTKPPSIRAPGMPRSTTVHNLSARSATTAVIELGRRTELPVHLEATACREAYETLLGFVRADPGRARHVATQIVDVLEWFQRYEADPALGLMR